MTYLIFWKNISQGIVRNNRIKTISLEAACVFEKNNYFVYLESSRIYVK